MAHGITTADKFAYTNIKPWHNLGVDLTLAPPRTVEEILAAGGLDFDAVSVPSGFMHEGTFYPNGRYDIVRSDRPTTVIGTGLSKRYEIVQARDVFGPLLQPYFDSNLLTWTTAGSLWGGSKFFVVAKINRATLEIVPGMQTDTYMLWAGSHDGSLAVTTGYTSICVVCGNTLKAAIGDKASALLKIRHSSGAKEAIEAANQSIDLASKGWAMQAEQIRALSKVRVDKKTMEKYIRQVFSLKDGDGTENDEGKRVGKGSRIITRAEDLFESAMGMELPGVRGTALGALMATTQYLTHEAVKAPKGKKGAEEARGKLLDSNLLGGQGGDLIDMAFAEAVKIAKVGPRNYALAA
jgi:phage/plasmid-like protein (TIGR03299 family)